MTEAFVKNDAPLLLFENITLYDIKTGNFEMNSLLQRRTALGAFALLMLLVTGCSEASLPAASATAAKTPKAPDVSFSGSRVEIKIGVLLVSHGSHSEQWRKMLTNIEDTLRDKILQDGQIAGIKSSFMEYTEPSIATRLKEFDAEGYAHVIIVPILLTVSSHSFDDIPVIAGQKVDHATLETLKLEGAEIYKPKAKVTMAPLLDFPDVLEKNVSRRVQEQSDDPANEGMVLVAYGSEPYDEEWKELLEGVSNKVREETGIDASEYCWCGHIAHYKSEPTEKAIKKILAKKETAIVIPVLVAVDENFQGKIIGGAVKNVDLNDRIRYRGDSILPDANINNWVVHVSRKLAAELTGPAVTTASKE